MAGVNKVIIVGRLGSDPESKWLTSGSQVTNFSVATSENWTKDGQRQEKTEWHRIVAFGKLAEICSKYLVKGKEVYLEGKLQTRSWEQDGVKRYSTEILANQLQMLGSKDDSEPRQQPSGTPHQEEAAPYGQATLPGVEEGGDYPF